MRIAFFGGSFDPPHLGHLAVARAAQQALRLDRILFAPVGLQPLKPLGSSASFEDRVAMTQLAIQQDPAFLLSLADAPKPGDPRPNYTIDTLTQLRQSLPSDSQLYLLLGADSFLTLHHWHRAAEVPFAANLVVATRPGSSIENIATLLPQGIRLEPDPTLPNTYLLFDEPSLTSTLTILPDLNFEISATDLRNQILRYQILRNQIVPDQVQANPSTPGLPIEASVLAYIRQHRLYPQ